MSKFNVGDRVRSKFYGIVGTVIDVDTDGYIINPDHVEEMWIAEEDAEAYDPKTAFLSELKGLLEKYGAVINASWNDGWQADDAKCPRIDVDICLGNGEYIDFDDVLAYSLTTDNIMDYDKE